MAAPDIEWMSCTAPIASERAQSLTQRRYRKLIPLAAIATIVLVSVAFRLFGVSLESIDGDEAFSYRVASSHLPAAIAAIRNDLVHPPLYYFVLRGWLSIVGHASPLALRAVSLAFGLATITLLAGIAWVLPQIRRAALLADCLLAASNLHIFYSQQIRSYAFYTFLFTVLLIWSWQIARFGEKFAFWCVGTVLMSILVYTHYVGAVYVACIILGITLSPVPSRAKFRVWVGGFVAACSFMPWIVAEIGPAHQHHGTQDNLSWEALPSAYDLKAIWAGYLGVPNFHSGTTIVFLMGCALTAFSLFPRRREQNSFRRLFVITLAFTAFIPPCLLFLLSLKPISLPIFGARHLLPSIVSYLLLVAEGLVQLSNRLRARSIAFALGFAALLVLELIPTVAALSSEPRRMPYQTIVKATQGNVPIYTTWPYGIGTAMGFYEHDQGVIRKLPSDLNRLPGRFILVFRPGVPQEEREFENILKLRWVDHRNRDFYNGPRSGYFVRVAELDSLLRNEPGP